MSDSISALSTSTSPRFSRDVERRLEGSVVSREELTAADRDQMYGVLERYFSGTARARFESDLEEKEGAILLRDSDKGRIQGFSTFLRMRATIDGRDLVAFFSGDTIVDRDYWNETLLSRMWGRMVFAEADRLEVPVYWFLISSGYKTWRFLPIFFRRFFPLHDDGNLSRIASTLGSLKFGDEYLPEQGVVRFRHPTPLRAGVADLTEQRLRDPHIAYFAKKNPGWARGDELVCLTEVSRANLTRAGERMVRS